MDASALEQVYGAFQDFHAYFGPLFGRREARDHKGAQLGGAKAAGVPLRQPLDDCRCPSLPAGSPRSRGSISASHTPSKGSGRVRHLRSCFVSDGQGPRCHFRADHTLIPAMAAAVS